MRVWQRGARPARHDGWEGESLTPGVPKLLLEHTGDRQLAHADMDLRERAIEGGRRHVRGALDLHDLAVVLALPQRLDEIDGRPPLPARARLDQALEVAMRNVRGLEADHLKSAELRELLPQTGPQARWLDHD